MGKSLTVSRVTAMALRLEPEALASDRVRRDRPVAQGSWGSGPGRGERVAAFKKPFQPLMRCEVILFGLITKKNNSRPDLYSSIDVIRHLTFAPPVV